MVPIIAVLVLTFCFSGVAYAQEAETTLPDPGITPDSPFYFMDRWGKQISLAFTFNAQHKVEKALRYADERMAEIDAMMARNKIREATQAANEYQNCLEIATKNMEQARLRGADVSEKVALMAERHIGYLSDSTDNTTEDARNLMTQTRERAMTCQETALRNMAQGDPEKAARLNLQLMERQLNRIRTQAEDGKGEAVRARVEAYNRLENLVQEISQIAKGLGTETTVDQLVGMATAHHLEVLAQVQERVQGRAQEAVQAAIENCIQNHERLVNRLQERNQLGNVPQELPNANMYQNRAGQQATQGATGTANTTQTQAGQGSSPGGPQRGL
ncbi:MAG: DUF5667 domain-containing protein [candidate division KSB1 bacterium]|nr:DUF5667 domain-containing protein [candidate division KSB1 bacterium]